MEPPSLRSMALAIQLGEGNREGWMQEHLNLRFRTNETWRTPRAFLPTSMASERDRKGRRRVPAKGQKTWKSSRKEPNGKERHVRTLTQDPTQTEREKGTVLSHACVLG